MNYQRNKTLGQAMSLPREARVIIDTVHDVEAEALPAFQDGEDDTKYDTVDCLDDADEAIGEALERFEAATGMPSRTLQLGKDLLERLGVLEAVIAEKQARGESFAEENAETLRKRSPMQRPS